MSFAVVLEGMSIVAYLIILSGSKRLRENGWRVLSLLIILSVVIQAASMSLVVGNAESWAGRSSNANVGPLAGIPIRQRRPVLCWLEAGSVLGFLHCQLVYWTFLRLCGHHLGLLLAL